MKTRPEIKAFARESVAAQRGKAIMLELAFFGAAFGAGFVIGLLGLISPVLYGILFIAFICVFMVVYVNAYGEHIKVYRREPASVGAQFTGLKVNFWRKLGGVLWMELWILIWSLLLIIPGIIKTLAYSMTVPILAEHTSVEARQALKISMKMTDGHKGKIFVFGLSFIGWFLLSSLPIIIAWPLTFEIVGTELLIVPGMLGVFLFACLLSLAFDVLYLFPYFYTAFMGLYTELRDKALRDGKITPQELGMAPPSAHENIILN